MPFSFQGIEVFFYTMAVTAFVLGVLYIVRRRRTNFHYQAAHNLDEEEVSFGTETTKRTQSNRSSPHSTSRSQPREQKQRDELFDDDRSGTTEAADEFDRDELDQLRMLSAVRAANNNTSSTTSKAVAALIDDSDDSDDDDVKSVVIDIPSRVPTSQPTQPPLPSPHRLQHRQSASMQQSGGGGKDGAGKDDGKEERKEADVSIVSRADRHERAVV